MKNEEIDIAFKGTKFGLIGNSIFGRRTLIAHAIMKLNAGYSIGNTMAEILIKLKITTKNQGMPAKWARRWAYDQLHFFFYFTENCIMSDQSNKDQ